jgi:hypothetical protein
MIYRKKAPGPPPKAENLERRIFLINKRSKVEMLNYKRSLIIKSLASLSPWRGTEGEAYEF